MLVSGEGIQTRQKIQGSPVTFENLGDLLWLRHLLSGGAVPNGWITLCIGCLVLVKLREYMVRWCRVQSITVKNSVNSFYFTIHVTISDRHTDRCRSQPIPVRIDFISLISYHMSRYPIGVPITIVPNRKQLSFSENWVINSRSIHDRDFSIFRKKPLAPKFFTLHNSQSRKSEALLNIKWTKDSSLFVYRISVLIWRPGRTLCTLSDLSDGSITNSFNQWEAVRYCDCFVCFISQDHVTGFQRFSQKHGQSRFLNLWLAPFLNGRSNSYLNEWISKVHWSVSLQIFWWAFLNSCLIQGVQ
jgi:hypothetical protein